MPTAGGRRENRPYKGNEMYLKKMIGDKCYLAPIDVNDTEQYAVWLNDMEITKYLLIGTGVVSMEGEREALAQLSKEHVYGIVDKEKGILIGNVGLSNLNHIHKTAEIGIFIGNKEYWGKGYGTEAMSLLIDYSFKILGLENIILKVFSFNARARRSYEKVGFRRIGERRKAHYFNNERHDVTYMDIVKDDFYRAGMR